MLRNILILMVFITSMSLAQETTSNVITWKEGVFLQPQDFKMEREVNPFNVKNAITTYKIEILPKEVAIDENNNIYGYQKMNVATFFYKNKSWLGNKDNKNELAHEQIHFDIAELFARKIRKDFEDLKSKKVKDFDAYQHVYNTQWTACQAYQNQYDSETANGAMAIENNEWLLKIDKELYELNAYSYERIRDKE